MRIIGIDENGLGPLLGPLVVTGAAFCAPTYDRELMFRAVASKLVAADSKVVFAGRRSRAEDAVLGWLELFGIRASNSAALAEAVVLPPPWKRPCPSPVPTVCTGADEPLPRGGSHVQDRGADGAREALEHLEIRALRVAAHSLCAGELNNALDDARGNKLQLDFALMMRVARELAAGSDDNLVLCGKVGGTAAYARWFEAEGLTIDRTVCEGRDESAYDVQGVGRVCFLRDGDGSHLPIAVASMVGKYLRELAMERLNKALGWGDDRFASGYRDVVTRRFVEETRGLRTAAQLPESCFSRKA